MCNIIVISVKMFCKPKKRTIEKIYSLHAIILAFGSETNI